MPLTPTLSPLVPRGEREKISGGCVKMRPWKVPVRFAERASPFLSPLGRGRILDE